MRKTIVIALGAVAVAVLAVSGVAAAMDDGTSPSASPSISPSAGLGSAAVSADEARSIATSAVPGGVVTEIDLRDGRWKVHLEAPDGRYEVLIDATSGAIIKLERSGAGLAGSPSATRGDDDRDDHGDDDHRGRNRGGHDSGHDDSGHDDDGHDDDGGNRGPGSDD
jgi:hypothetical protein